MTGRAHPSLSRGWFVLTVVAVIALAINLRPAVNALGAALPEIRESLSLSGTAGGALTSLAPLCFVVLGLLAPGLAGRFGARPVLAVALLVLTAGQFVRILGSVGALFAGSVLALAGLAVGNVLLPSLIRRYFPDRIPTMTAVYTTSLAIGATASSALTVPIERGLEGDWRTGIGAWAFTAAIALVPWIAMLFRPEPRTGATGQRIIRIPELVRSPVAWAMGLFFGLQSVQAYIVTAWFAQILVDDGADPAVGGYAIGLFAGLGIPLSAVIPTLLGRQSRLPAMVVTLSGFYLLGYAGLLIEPAALWWLWAILIGLGSATFPLALTLIALRARTAEGVAALSAFTQSLGYLVATTGPLTIGWLHDVTGGWTAPLITLMVIAAAMALFGLRVARPRVIEDDLAPRPES